MAYDNLALSDKVGTRQYASYYSGTDIRVYFGDKWVDEIVEIEWTLQEQVAPIFGHSSYTWDRVARGNRYVVGSFAVNFKEVGYLQTIINSLSSDMNENETWFNLEEFDGSKGPDGAASKATSIELLLENFDDQAQDFENAIWGKESDQSEGFNTRQASTFFYDSLSNENHKKLRDHGFNILLTYGGTDNSHGTATKNTAQSIVGVQLTGVSQQVDPSGNPTREIYSFLAKDISANVQQSF